MWGGPSGTRIPELLSLLEGVGLPGRPRLTRLPPGKRAGWGVGEWVGCLVSRWLVEVAGLTSQPELERECA
jgi:hypothetical protein